MNNDRGADRIGLQVREEAGRTILTPTGEWSASTVAAVDQRTRDLRDSVDPGAVVVDLSGMGYVDTAGAFTLGRVLDRCAYPDADFHFEGDHPTARRLMALTRERMAPCPAPPPPPPTFIVIFERAGEMVVQAARDFVALVAFFGAVVTSLARAIVNPSRFRWASLFRVMEEAGVNALPIVAVLSFFVGATVAFLGARILTTFGASIFSVELVGFAVLREFGVLITAIIMAGRSDSAFTASIGAMRMQQEIDAMRVLGLDPVDALVLPRVIACVIMTPLIAVAAVIAGLFGGMVVLWATLDIAPSMYVARLEQSLGLSHFWAGLAKAPVFGLVVALVGCRHGLLVGGDVESLGHHVTAAVVQSIFAVIVIDAVFAMVYLELGI